MSAASFTTTRALFDAIAADMAPAAHCERRQSPGLREIHDELEAGFLAAITEDPTRSVPTPGYAPLPCNVAFMPAFKIVAEECDDEEFQAITYILGQCAKSTYGIPIDVHMTAKALVSKLARRYAEFHRDDEAYERQEGREAVREEAASNYRGAFK